MGLFQPWRLKKMISFMIDSMQRLEKSFRDSIQKLKIKLKIGVLRRNPTRQ